MEQALTHSSRYDGFRGHLDLGVVHFDPKNVRIAPPLCLTRSAH